MFENKKIYILGMARSGYEAAKLLAKHHNIITIIDVKEQPIEQIEELKKLGIQVIIDEKQESYLDESYDYVVKNPGIRCDVPAILKAEKLHIPIINEVELGYHFLPNHVKIVAVTGSNGKTTTTTLIYELLKNMDIPVHLAGNIGFPLCSIVDAVKDGDTIVLEISAQQLHDMNHFKADIAVLTNLTPVHLDFFGTYDHYIEMKHKLVENQDESDIAILNLDDPLLCEKTEDIRSKCLYFSLEKKADIYKKGNTILVDDQKWITLDEIKLKGDHNYQNIMCALLVAQQYGMQMEKVKEVLQNFGGVEHRLEYVAEVNGRIFYNDSKATNTKSTSIALKSFDKPTILLLGGLDRGHSFDELEPDMVHVSHVVCYGETKQRINDFCKQIGKSCTIVDTLEQATKQGYQLSKSGDIILLSPACASWDQYACFEDRGNDFKRVVKEWLT